MTCMFLGQAKIYRGGTYCMLNLRMEFMVLSCAVIWAKNMYGKYKSRKQHTKADDYVLQNKNDSNKWAKVKIDL